MLSVLITRTNLSSFPLNSAFSPYGVPSLNRYQFGGFIGQHLADTNRYYGNGESFVFSMRPEPAKYPWTRNNDLFCLTNRSRIAMGGGSGISGGFAFQVRSHPAFPFQSFTTCTRRSRELYSSSAPMSCGSSPLDPRGLAPAHNR